MPATLSSCVLLALPMPASASGAEGVGGGTAVPQTLTAPPSTKTGGAPAGKRPQHRKRRRAARRRFRGPLLASFSLRRPRLYLYGRPAQVAFRIRSRVKLSDVRISVVARGARASASTIRLGARAAGRRHKVALTGRETGTLAEGSYRVRISARDARGRRLRRGAGVSSTGDLSFFHHRFPLAGPFTYGGADGRFGAPRGDHIHRGQDLAAAAGTPVLAPRGGVVEAVQYQPSGAGHYVVLDGADEELDYVFMHLRSGSIPVREGQTVRTGQRLGEVGNTGRSSGAHLHFEVWTGGWFSGGRPIDPLPLLRAWEPLS